MGLAKTEKELREETRARRAKHELKNTPLPLKRHNSLHKRSQKKLFADSASSDVNNKSITSLMTRRVMTSLAHSRSMTDLRHDPVITSQYSRSCADLRDLRRSKSYSRITDQHSSWDKRLDNYRSTMSDMFTNVKTYSSKSIAALSSDNLLKAIRQGNTPGHEREDRLLRDPCWRAKRVGEQYQPVQYSWREKLGMQERLSSHSLSRSTPNISQLAGVASSRSRVRTVSESPHLSASYLPYSARSNLGTHSKSCTNINTCSDSSSSYLNTSSNYLNTTSDSTGYSMKKALRQLKVATSWLSSSATKQQDYSYSSPSSATTTATAARWSTTASHNRFSNIRARFA